ncbi:MAG: histidine kinase, partial [bacterium]|nr:histidine kinase [bacterium]
MKEPGAPKEERPFGWLGISVAWFLWGLENTARLRAQVPDIGWHKAAWYGMPDALVWALLTPLVVRFVRWTDASGRSLRRTLPLHLGAAVGVAFLHSLADAGIAALRNLAGGHASSYGMIFQKVLTHTFQLNLLMYFLVAGLAYYVSYSRRLAERDRRTAELRAQLTEAQLQSLQTQLRPHFLFNALHTVSSLMETEPRRGQRVIRQLGDLLR